MRRFVCLLVAVLLCTMMVCPAMAATDTFVLSIGYKDGPNVEDATRRRRSLRILPRRIETCCWISISSSMKALWSCLPRMKAM